MILGSLLSAWTPTHSHQGELPWLQQSSAAVSWLAGTPWGRISAPTTPLCSPELFNQQPAASPQPSQNLYQVSITTIPMSADRQRQEQETPWPARGYTSTVRDSFQGSLAPVCAHNHYAFPSAGSHIPPKEAGPGSKACSYSLAAALAWNLAHRLVH